MANSHIPHSTLPQITVIVAGDPQQKTGGYTYVRHMVEALSDHGARVNLVGIAGSFPVADEEAAAALDSALATVTDDTIAIIDGLALGNLPKIAEKHRHRLQLVALVHHPLADETGLSEALRAQLEVSEMQALAAVQGVIVTSHFTAHRLSHWNLAPDRVRVVEPGVHRAPGTRLKTASAPAPNTVLRLLCAGSLIPRKGQDVLLRALARCRGSWHCDLVGSTTRDAAFAHSLEKQILELDLGASVVIRGEITASELARFYEHADLLVLPSWYEGYGMVITEALAWGLPVLSTNGGALADTVPAQAGLMVLPGDSESLAAALESLAEDPARLQALTQGARDYRDQLRSWQQAGREFEEALAQLTVLDSPPRQQTQFTND